MVNCRTSLRAESSSQVFAGSRTVHEDKSPVQRPEGNESAGPTFKTDLPHKSSLSIATDRIRFGRTAGDRKTTPRAPLDRRLGMSLQDRKQDPLGARQYFLHVDEAARTSAGRSYWQVLEGIRVAEMPPGRPGLGRQSSKRACPAACGRSSRVPRLGMRSRDSQGASSE